MFNQLTLSRFTPSLLTQDALEALFVQHETLAERLVDNIRISALTPNKHYALLVGPRGIGKTHLVSLIYHRIQTNAELQAKLRVAWLREREWSVTSYLDLLISIIRALEEARNDEKMPRASEGLYKHSIGDVEREAERLLLESAKDGTILIIAENLDAIFEALEEEGQQKLRALIQNNPVFTILATTRGLFGSVTLRESPFYGFFDIHHLKTLNVDDAIALLTKISRRGNDETLATLLNTAEGRARIRAVHYLVGGNPRLYVMFSQFLTHDSLESLVAPVVQTLDDLTSYYQERMARLSPQQRKIVQFLCDRRGAIPVKIIAEENFITHQTASSQLKKLTDFGYVRSEQRGRESYYELSEPLMRISLSVKKYHGESVGLLVDFLRLWYSHAELNQRLDSLGADASIEKESITMALKLQENELVQSVKKNPTGASQGESKPTLGLDRYEDTAQSSKQILAMEHQNAYPNLVQENSSTRLPRAGEAVHSYNQAVPPDPRNTTFWGNYGARLHFVGSHEEALNAYNNSLMLDPMDVDLRMNQSIVLMALGQYQEALDSINKINGDESKAVDLHRRLLLAVATMFLGEWGKGQALLRDALTTRESDTELMRSENTMVNNMPLCTQSASIWRRHIRVWIEIFSDEKALNFLGQWLVGSIRTLNSPQIGIKAANAWLSIWSELGAKHEELALPIRLLKTAVEYHEGHDDRVLFQLAYEERQILKSILGISPPL